MNIFFDGRSFGPDGSGYVAQLSSGKYIWTRGILCGKVTSNVAVLMALYYTVLSIKNKSAKIIFSTPSKYITLMFGRDSNGNFIKQTDNIQSNRELISKIRRELLQVPKYAIENSNDDKIDELLINMMRTKTEFFKKS
jgi:ribonuclease HI